MSLLLLAPTRLEQKRVASLLTRQPAAFELCGFGPIAAAARTAFLIERQQPTLVLLSGIAGTYDQAKFPPGSAACFDRVLLDGLGAGSAAAFISAREMGFPQWTPDGGKPVFDELPLTTPAAARSAGALVTKLAASAGDACVQDTLARYPQAVAEDMEGAGVALACSMAGTPLVIIRGASNVAGDRDKKNWRIDEALAAVAAQIDIILEHHAH